MATEFWQDYALHALQSDAHLVVGLYFSDESEKAPGCVPSGAPIVWIAAKVWGEGQHAAYEKLNADRPNGWYPGPALRRATAGVARANADSPGVYIR